MAFPDAFAQQRRRVDGAAHDVEVGAGIGAPDDGPGSRQTSAFNSQSASDSGIGGRSPVRSSSAMTMSSRASKGSWPRSVATSPTVRPS